MVDAKDRSALAGLTVLARGSASDTHGAIRKAYGVGRNRVAAQARDYADQLDRSAPKGDGAAEYHFAAMTLRAFVDVIEAVREKGGER
jgi:hypothetical protein